MVEVEDPDWEIKPWSIVRIPPYESSQTFSIQDDCVQCVLARKGTTDLVRIAASGRLNYAVTPAGHASRGVMDRWPAFLAFYLGDFHTEVRGSGLANSHR